MSSASCQKELQWRSTLVGLIHFTATLPKVAHCARETSPKAPSPILASTLTCGQAGGAESRGGSEAQLRRGTRSAALTAAQERSQQLWQQPQQTLPSINRAPNAPQAKKQT